jgi:nickel transport protein
MFRYLLAVIVIALSGEALAHSLQHQVDEGPAVSVRLFYEAGSDFSFEGYELYRAGDETPFQVGRTDLHGRIVFIPDRAGTWRIKAFSEDGHGAEFSFTTTIGVGVGAVERSFLESYSRIVVGVSVIFGLFGLVSLLRKRRRS